MILKKSLELNKVFKYVLFISLLLLLNSCGLNKRINHNSTDQLNSHLYRVHKSINSYSELNEKNVAHLTDAITNDAIKLCEGLDGIHKTSMETSYVKLSSLRNEPNYMTTMTAIINCKEPVLNLFEVESHNIEDHMKLKTSFNVFGSDFKSLIKLKEYVNTVVASEHEKYCGEEYQTNDKSIDFKLIQLLKETPYTFDESNEEMLDFLGYEVAVELTCKK